LTAVLIVSGVAAVLAGALAFAATRSPVALVAGFAIVAVGAGVPATVVAHSHDKQGQKLDGRPDLSKAQAHGRELFAASCATCHTLAASSAVGRVGPNLDTLYDGKVPAALVLNAIQQGRAFGRGQMPAGLLQGQDAKDVAAYVTTVAGNVGG
jgi:mono/diheme cytochrome c family protein